MGRALHNASLNTVVPAVFTFAYTLSEVTRLGHKYFLHISVERESLSVMSIPQTFRIFEERSFSTTFLFTRSTENTSQVTALKCFAAKPAN